MICAHRYLDNVDGLPCIREDHPENPGGHVYKDGRGSELNDRHGEEGHG